MPLNALRAWSHRPRADPGRRVRNERQSRARSRPPCRAVHGHRRRSGADSAKAPNPGMQRSDSGGGPVGGDTLATDFGDRPSISDLLIRFAQNRRRARTGSCGTGRNAVGCLSRPVRISIIGGTSGPSTFATRRPDRRERHIRYGIAVRQSLSWSHAVQTHAACRAR
jgi:hypothetical protein